MAAEAEPPARGAAGPVVPPQPGLVNLANVLTVVRLVLVPVVVACLLAGGTAWRVAAFVAFGTASVTDLLDGRVARSRGLITDFGKIADPIADKALMGAALVALSALGRLWWWVTIVILVRELGITLLRFWVIRYGVIAASQGGKLKTLLQALAIFIAVLPLTAVPGLAWLGWISTVIMGAALVVTVVTGADYVVEAIRLRRPARAGDGPEPGAPTEGA